MSSNNTTLYYTALDDIFRELQLDASVEEQVEPEPTWTATPKRLVRLRKQNLFATEKKDFVICRRLPRLEADKELEQLSPSTRELRRHQQAEEVLQQRRQRWEAEQKRPTRRLTIRI